MGAAASVPPPPPTPRPPLGPRPTNADPLLSGSLRTVDHGLPVQKSCIIRNSISLSKPSLRLVRSSSDPFVYRIQFHFTAYVPGNISIYYSAREVVHRAHDSDSAPVENLSYVGASRPGKTPFEPDVNQTYLQKDARALDVRRFKTADLTYRDGVYPIVIRLEADYSNSSIPHNQRVKCEVTFAQLTVTDGEYGIAIIAQQVLINSTVYHMREMYGIGATDVTASQRPDGSLDVDASKHECVVCLTEPCNTALLPCSHLCLCEECARMLCREPDINRRRCPVCRAALISTLKFISGVPEDVFQQQQQAQSSSDAQTPSAPTPNKAPVSASAPSADADSPDPAPGNTLPQKQVNPGASPP